MSKVSGKVTKVESKGLYIKLESGKDAFLPKENMFIGKKKNKSKAPVKKEVKEQPEIQKKQEVPEEKEEPKQETKTLKDLKKLQFIGNMKISVGKGKKSNITELSEEKEEKK